MNHSQTNFLWAMGVIAVGYVILVGAVIRGWIVDLLDAKRIDRELEKATVEMNRRIREGEPSWEFAKWDPCNCTDQHSARVPGSLSPDEAVARMEEWTLEENRLGMKRETARVLMRGPSKFWMESLKSIDKIYDPYVWHALDDLLGPMQE